MHCTLAPWSISTFAAVLLWGMGAAHSAERHLADFQDLSASVPAGFVCAPEVTVTVRALDESAFKGDRVELQKLIGGLRAILGFECPDTTITDLLIVGEAGGQEVYRGAASENGNWLLADLRPSPATAPTDRELVPEEATSPGQLPREAAQLGSSRVATQLGLGESLAQRLDAAIDETQSETESQTAALTVGDVNVGEELTEIVQDAQAWLEASTDVPSAEAAVPMLNDLNAQLEELSATVDQLPENTKKALADLLIGRVMELKTMADSVTDQEGVGDVVTPALEPIMAKLDEVAVRYSAGILNTAHSASVQTSDNDPIIVALDGMDVWATCASNASCVMALAAAATVSPAVLPAFQALSNFSQLGRLHGYLGEKLSSKWGTSTCSFVEKGPFCELYTVPWSGAIANNVYYYDYIDRTKDSILALSTQFQPRPLVVVAHSWGSVVAFKVLTDLADQLADRVILLVTLGSPLQTDNAFVRAAVTNIFSGGIPGNEYVLEPRPLPKSVDYWINFYISGVSGVSALGHQSDYIATARTAADENRELPPVNIAFPWTHSDYFDDASNAKTMWNAITRILETLQRPIEQVDFLNFTYPLSEDCGPKTISLINGGFKGENSRVRLQRQVVYTDFTGDNRNDAIVPLDCDYYGNYFLTEIFFYTMRDGEAKLIIRLTESDIERDYRSFYPDGFSFGIINVGAAEGKLIIEKAADGSHACPENEVTFEYRWNGQSLALAGKPAKKPLATGCGAPAPTSSQTENKWEVCTIDVREGTVTETGVVVYGGYGHTAKLRIDLEIGRLEPLVPRPGPVFRWTKVRQHVVINSLMAYMWQDSDNHGYKMRLKAEPANQAISARLAGQKGIRDCREWHPDATLFEAPTNIEFILVTKENLTTVKKKFWLN